MLRAVLDTNVLVSAVISDGKARALLKKGIAGQYRIVTSDMILTELAIVLSRSKFKITKEDIARITTALRRTAEIVKVKTELKVVKDDPKDDMVLETAFDGGAHLIVTGDNHLLEIETYREIEIVTIEKMIAYLKAPAV
jgi:uncharacterized protein